MNRVSRKYEHTHVSLLKSVSLSIHFHFLWFRQVYWRDLQSDQISRQHQNIHCIILFLLSLLWCAVQCIGWPPWSPGFISRLFCTRGDRTTFSRCCVTQPPVAWKQEHEKESWAQDTLDTDGHSALNMIWFDQIGGRTTHHTQTGTQNLHDVFAGRKMFLYCQALAPNP